MESVSDYPRPPAVEPCGRRVRVRHGDVLIADSTRALRVLETTHPPTIYVPPADVRMDLLRSIERSTVCEYKGRAAYFDVVVDGRTASAAAWTYPAPRSGYEALRDHVAFYASRVDECLLDDERVRAQPGGFYGGWITADIRGPYKR
jgi:uncharacterized protein (DUF427 family)